MWCYSVSGVRTAFAKQYEFQDLPTLCHTITTSNQYVVIFSWGSSNVLQKQDKIEKKQEGQRCPKRRVAQAAIRLVTAVITFRNKERNVRSPS